MRSNHGMVPTLSSIYKLRVCVNCLEFALTRPSFTYTLVQIATHLEYKNKINLTEISKTLLKFTQSNR